MSPNEFTGALVVSLGAILALMGTLNKFITQPINNLNTSVIRLTAKMENTDSNVERIDKRVDTHGKRLDEHDKILARNNLQ